MPSNYLILCHPLLLLPSIFPRIRVFSNESVLRMRWPKYWSFSINISTSNEHPGLISPRMISCNTGDVGLISGSGRSFVRGYGNPLQYSCLENPHGQRSLMGYSPCGCKWVGHDWLGTTQQSFIVYVYIRVSVYTTSSLSIHHLWMLRMLP